jgi:hypothetical protein
LSTFSQNISELSALPTMICQRCSSQRSFFSVIRCSPRKRRGHEGAAAEGGDQGHHCFMGWIASDKSRKFGCLGASNSTKIDDLMIYELWSILMVNNH